MAFWGFLLFVLVSLIVTALVLIWSAFGYVLFLFLRALLRNLTRPRFRRD